MKILVIGDPHFKGEEKNRPGNKLQTDKMRLASLELVKKVKPDRVVITGDTLDRFNRIDCIALSDAIEWIYTLAEQKNEKDEVVEVDILIGNHDRPSNEDFMTDYHPFSGIRNQKNIHIVSSIRHVYSEELDSYFMFAPYVPNGKLKDAIRHLMISVKETSDKKSIFEKQDDSIPKFVADASTIRNPAQNETEFATFEEPPTQPVDKPVDKQTGSKNKHDDLNSPTSDKGDNDIDSFLDKYATVFAHQEVRGAKYNGIVSEHGDDWGSTWPLLVLGHIHNYQKLGQNIIYVGTPMQHDFGDLTKKTVSLFTYDKSDPKHPKEERISLGLKERKVVTLTAEEAAHWKYDENYLWKLHICDTDSAISLFLQSNKYKKLKKLGVAVHVRRICHLEQKTQNEDGTENPVDADGGMANFSTLDFQSALIESVKGDKKQLKWLMEILKEAQ